MTVSYWEWSGPDGLGLAAVPFVPLRPDCDVFCCLPAAQEWPYGGAMGVGRVVFLFLSDQWGVSVI